MSIFWKSKCTTYFLFPELITTNKHEETNQMFTTEGWHLRVIYRDPLFNSTGSLNPPTNFPRVCGVFMLCMLYLVVKKIIPVQRCVYVNYCARCYNMKITQPSDETDIIPANPREIQTTENWYKIVWTETASIMLQCLFTFLVPKCGLPWICGALVFFFNWVLVSLTLVWVSWQRYWVLLEKYEL